MTQLIKHLLGTLAFVVIVVIIITEMGQYFIADPAALRFELAAYRDCIEQAQRCRMTPQDFIRYYELKHKLEIDDAKTNTE